jgi:hypothetical protein
MKSTLSLLEDPGLTTNDLKDRHFCLDEEYLITAKHVIEKLRDPMIGFHIVYEKHK